MLQEHDLPYIAKAVAPLAFTLVDGRVVVEVPKGLARDVPDGRGGTKREAYVSPMSQEDIEVRVAHFKRGEHRNDLILSFVDYLLVNSSVLNQYRQITGIDLSEYPNTDPEVELWLLWHAEVMAQIDNAKTASDVKIPKFPTFPSWHRQPKNLVALAKRLGHPGPFSPANPVISDGDIR
jgi:hypothetical protein